MSDKITRHNWKLLVTKSFTNGIWNGGNSDTIQIPSNAEEIKIKCENEFTASVPVSVAMPSGWGWRILGQYCDSNHQTHFTANATGRSTGYIVASRDGTQSPAGFNEEFSIYWR